MILAWLGAIVVGLSLGVLGSGGSILTVPILVYVAGRDRDAAIPESLAIVGTIALVGAIRAGLGRRVELRAVLGFGLPGMIGAVLGGSLGEAMPGAVQLVMLGIVMTLAAARMLGSGPALSEDRDRQPVRKPLWLFAALGVLVGMITGMVGIGGGFLIVPVLNIAAGLTMQRAIGTSLSIIVLTAGSGLIPYLGREPISWSTVLVFAGFGAAGSLAGQSIGGRLDQRTLKRIFGWFLIVLAIYILAREAPGLIGSEPTPQHAAGRPGPTPGGGARRVEPAPPRLAGSLIR